MYLHTPTLEFGSWWRVDTASGTNTPTTVYYHDGADPIGTSVGASGSTVRATSAGATAPTAHFWSATATLYCKQLDFYGAPDGTVVTSTGVLAPLPPADPVGPGAFAQKWSTPAISTTLTGTLTAWALTAVDCTAGAGARTLPAASSVPAGTEFAAKKADTSANALVISAAGSDLIFGTGAGTTSKTLTLAGEAVTFVSDGTSRWSIVSSDTPSGVLANTYAQKASNLSDLASASTARTNLGLGGAAILSTAQVAADSALTSAYAPIAASPVTSSATSGTLTAAADHNLSPTSAAAWTLPTGVAATKLPTTVKNNGTATVTVARGGSDTINGGTASVSIAAGEWARFTSDGSGAWTQSGTAGQSSTYGPPATTKRITLSLGADGSQSNNTGFADVCQRSLIILPCTTTRWRVKVSNTNPGTSAAITGALTFSDCYVGTPSFASSGAWAGDFTATPTRAFTGGTTPSDGSDWVSAWVTDPALQFQADTPAAISTAFTCTGGQAIIFGNNNYCWAFFTAGAAAQVGQTAKPTGSANLNDPFLDIRMEYETFSALPHVLVISDSTASGYTDDSALRTTAPGPGVAWPMLAGLRHRMLVTNASLGSMKYSNYNSLSNRTFTRLDLATSPPDIAILGCGINEVGAGITLATFETNLQTVKTLCASLGVKRFAATTVMYQPGYKPGLVTVGAASGVNTLTTSIAYANADVVDVDYSTTKAETLTVSGASTGNGPYTTTFTGNTTQAHGVGATISLQKDSSRYDYNKALVNGIAGVDEIIDFANAFVPGRDDLKRFWGVGAVHPGMAAQRIFANAVRVTYK